ncbi:hypothetical protein PRZ48_009258 [Zasmidium cellare]|uniref:Cupin type-1 domain-containing protein n=1 Tax=Zasmidium cellare TaxID=395010 RepID=A0ABR0EC95_ZASCE|nr:hypothetical protein PRZ48_009258 [Zasmidium cellare]
MPFQPDFKKDWQAQKVVKKDGSWIVEGHPPNQVELAWHESPNNTPGLAFVGLKVTSPVNAATPPHTHGGAAVSATVIQGRVLNQMICADGYVVGPKVYEKGESWYEAPGCHHVRSENAGDEEAMFIASLVVDEGVIKRDGLMKGLVVIDAEAEESKHNG